MTRARTIAGDTETAARFTSIRQQVLTTAREKEIIRREVPAMRERIRVEHSAGNPLKHAPGGLLDIEFVVQLGLLLNAVRFPEIIESTQIKDQLQALRDCGWINANAFKTLDSAYQQLSHARQQATLIDDSSKVETTPLLNIARALCEEILR